MTTIVQQREIITKSPNYIRGGKWVFAKARKRTYSLRAMERILDATRVERLKEAEQNALTLTGKPRL